MVELTRQPIRAISLWAGPGETGTPFDTNFRINESAVRAIGQQLAVVGDQLYQEWTSRQVNRHPTLLHLLGPAQALTRAIHRDINSQMWDFKGLSATAKAWIAGTMSGQRILESPNWVSSCKGTGWTRGAVVAVAVVALCCTLWIEWNA